MIEHVLASFQHEAKETQYRAYLTDALRIIGENTAKYVGGSYLTVRWCELDKPREEEDGDEIAADVIRRAGLRLTEENNG